MVSAPDAVETLRCPSGFLSSIEVEPVGRWFLSHWERLLNGRSLSATGQETESESESDDSTTEVEFEDDLEYLRSLDPKECKDQDHYRVLGLTDLRFRATDDQIKKAYRFKVLKHHPDKRRGLGEEIRDDDDYFTCITKAYEILGVPAKRRSYDSVDPTFEDAVPEKTTNGKDFYRLFGPAFKRNSRWSTRSPVPCLGDDEQSREMVEAFYQFWYNFESWREYSYLDEEDKEKGSDRDERRWIEKNNRVERAERKKEEMKRIRKLVDNAYNSDPRIAKFREAEKQEKLDRKKAKQDAARARKEEEERIKKEAEDRERVEREKKEAEERERLEKEKKEKEAQKKVLKRERKLLRGFCKENSFYAEKNNEEEKVRHMTELDKLCEILSAIELESLNVKLKGHETDRESARKAFLGTVTELNDKLEKEKLDLMKKSQKASGSAAKSSSSNKKEWSSDELSLLIKAVNLFPAGTNKRWDVVATFLNQHSKTPEIERNAKETLSKAKELQSGDFHLSCLKEETNKKAYENLEKQKKRDIKVDYSDTSTRTETAAEAQGLNVAPWSGEEQKLLEQALKTYPSNLGAERWEKIASCLPNRSKKDCMKRYKEIAELVRSKKAAKAAAEVQTAKK